MKNWPELVFNSHYLTAIEVKKSLEAGEVMEAEEEMDEIQSSVSSLTWREVFEDEYML